MSDAAPTTPAPGVPPAMQADYQRWLEEKTRREQKRQAELDAMKPPFEAVATNPVLARAAAAEKSPVSEDEEQLAALRLKSVEEERLARFRRVCDAEFMRKIDRAHLLNPTAFDTVANWSLTIPGPIAVGRTGTAKTRAAWAALYRLCVKEGRAFAWFPVKRLITEFERYESKDLADEFWRNYSRPRFDVLFVDDVDKINWQFESQGAALFSFYDWVYRAKIACITTTNKERAWWADKMGEAFARRLFEGAHFEVKF